MLRWLTFLCVLPLVLSVTAFGQSNNKATPGFSCSGNLFPTEAVICSDEGLASLDRQLAAVYGSNLKNLPADQQAELKATERTWVAEPNRCGTDRSCIRNAYQPRISSLCSLFSVQATIAASSPDRLAEPHPAVRRRSKSQLARSTRYGRANLRVPKSRKWPPTRAHSNPPHLGLDNLRAARTVHPLSRGRPCRFRGLRSTPPNRLMAFPHHGHRVAFATKLGEHHCEVGLLKVVTIAGLPDASRVMVRPLCADVARGPRPFVQVSVSG